MSHQSIKRRLSLLELDSKPKAETHYRWDDNCADEAEYRQQNNIPAADVVITIGWNHE